MKLVLLGPPGSGKGTQCKRIVDNYGLTHLSSGDILRAERAANSELGQKAQSYMDAGKLVPDDVIIGMMIGAIKKAQGGYVLDGFPRTVVQAEELDKALDEIDAKIDAVVDLQVPDEVIESRMTGRRSCPDCGAVYHIENLKPKVEGKCDNCGSDLVQRPNNTPEVVENRLKIYHEQTAAVAGYYKSAGKKIIEIDANKSVEEVTASVFSELDKIK